jgi:transcriptional regulator with XRE-family HTH domain
MTTPTYPLFAARLRQARKAVGLTQLGLARACGLAPYTVNDLEAGGRLPTVFVFLRLAERLDVSCDWLLGRCEDVRSHKP